MEKVILFYKFCPIADPAMTRLWQLELGGKLGLKGRVIISLQGINGTLGGRLDDLLAYKRAMNKSGIFRGIDYKWSAGGAEDFPRLSVKVRDELVAFKSPGEIKLHEKGIINGGKHIKPDQLHKLVEERGDDVVFFDGRNKYEAAIGKFKNAVVPDVENSRDFIREIEDPKYDAIKDKPVVTYCTGGIRCEILSAALKNRGFKEVYQLDGGIVKYGEKYGDQGLWEGKLHIFDGRMLQAFSDQSKDIGSCVHCQAKTSLYLNCANKHCNKLVLVCSDCAKDDLCSSCLASKTASPAAV